MRSAWIVGKGPSLQYLTTEDIGKGPVIAINQAIIKIEQLHLPNSVYSMQKDGGDIRKFPHSTIDASCDFKNRCGNACGDMVKPKHAVLLLHDGESTHCFNEYHPRMVLKKETYGMPENRCSLVLATQFAKSLGCDHMVFLCCDAHVNGDLRTYIPEYGIQSSNEQYRWQLDELEPYLDGVTYEFAMPKIHNEIIDEEMKWSVFDAGNERRAA